MMKKRRDKIPTMRYIWKMIKYRPWLYLSNCILWSLIHVAPLIPGLLVKEFLDILSSSGKINDDILRVMVFMVVLAVARAATIEIGGRVDATHRFTMSAFLRRNLLEAILNNVKEGSKASLGESINCFRDDIGEIEDTISWTLDFIGEVIFSIVAIIILLSINVPMTLFVFAPLVVVIYLAQSARKNIGKYRINARNATGEVASAIGEIFNSIQAIKVSGSENHIIDNLNSLNKKRHKYMVKDKILNKLMDAIYDNTVNIGTGLILLLAGKYMRAGIFTVGDFSLFIYYLTFVADCTHFFGILLARYEQGGIAFKRMFMLLGGAIEEEKLLKHNSLYLKGDLPKKEIDIDVEELQELEIKNLTFMYNETNGIKDINLKIKKGQFTVITGRIGSGKTTFIKTILGVLPKDQGEFYWNGKKIQDDMEFFIPPVSAYTSQIPNLFSDSVKNNILLGLDEEAIDIESSIYSAVLERDMETLNEGIDTVIGSKGVKLSGGQKQRVAVARMFARQSQIYIFDDISSALDVETEINLWQRMFEREKKTCIVVSNRQVALRNADNILVMKDGHIEDQGTLEYLLENCDEMKQIWGSEDITVA